MALTNIEATSLPHLKDFGVLLGLVSLAGSFLKICAPYL